jgi:hypothetical protein
MGAGVMAGFGLWGSMFPIDTIKSKIQADSLSRPQFKSAVDCLERSIAVEVRTADSRLAGCCWCSCFALLAAHNTLYIDNKALLWFEEQDQLKNAWQSCLVQRNFLLRLQSLVLLPC